MANLDLLQARKTAILTALAGLTPYTVPDLPNPAGGGSLSYAEYKQGLYDELAKINGLIAAEVGPWEVQVKGQT